MKADSIHTKNDDFPNISDQAIDEVADTGKKTMRLKILLPFDVFLDIGDVHRIVAETSNGYYGFLPQRLDCVAALVAGIFTYETTQGIKYIAVNEGLLVKTGESVLVSVRNAIGGADLGKLHEMVKNEFYQEDESERNIRAVSAKLETGLIYSIEKLDKQ